HGEERGCRRRHAAREEQARLRPLERGQLVLRDPLGGIAIAAVLDPLDAPLEVVLQLLGVGERVGRGLDDRRRERVARLGPRLARVHGHGARAEGPDRRLALGTAVAAGPATRTGPGHRDTSRRARSTWRAMARAT